MRNLRLPSIDAIILRTKQSLTQALKHYEAGQIGLNALKMQAQTVLRRSALAALATVNVAQGVSVFDDNVLVAASRVLANVFEYVDTAVANIAAGVKGATIAFAAAANSLYAVSSVASMQLSLDEADSPEDLEERRVINSDDTCPDCYALSALGWQPFGTLPEPGQDSVCGARCHCSVQVRDTEEGQTNGVVR